MTRFVLRRLAASFLLLYLVLTATFFLLHLAPGSPADLLFEGKRISAEYRENLRRIYGLDRSLPEQYVIWLGAVARGDWGMSYSSQRPAASVILDALPATLLLASAALVIQYTVGIALGIAAARRRGRAADHLIRIGSLLLYSQPPFWLGLMAILLFSLAWPILPAGHMRSVGAEDLTPAARFLDLLRHMALPCLVLGLTEAGATARFVRGSLLEVLGQEYIRAARAKGLSERRVVWMHGLRNILPLLLQLLALSASGLLSGSLVTEVIFSWPGLGRLTFEAILSRDYTLVLATTAFTAAIVLACNLVADVLHALADPRVRNA